MNKIYDDIYGVRENLDFGSCTGLEKYINHEKKSPWIPLSAETRAAKKIKTKQKKGVKNGIQK